MGIIMSEQKWIDINVFLIMDGVYHLNNGGEISESKIRKAIEMNFDGNSFKNNCE
jgi:sulfur relay (sulfurtransferase) complex TusBCD TusD component (DsrE family)